MKKIKTPKESNPIMADFILIFPTKHIKLRNKIDRRMSKLREVICNEANISGLIWSYGSHPEKKINKYTRYYVCFSAQESIQGQWNFYRTDTARRILSKVSVEMKEIGVKI